MIRHPRWPTEGGQREETDTHVHTDTHRDTHREITHTSTHLRHLQRRLKMIKMHRRVIGHKAKLRPGVPREAVQCLFDRLNRLVHDPVTHSGVAHIHHKHIDRGLGGAHHVFAGGDEFDGAVGKLWAGVFVSALVVLFLYVCVWVCVGEREGERERAFV